MSTPATNRLVVLAARPSGRPVPENFRLVEEPLPELRDGQALVRNDLMSVDPAMRPRMNDVPSYVAPFEIGAPLEGRAIGEVVASKSAALPEGAMVRHALGWRDYATIDDGTVVDTTLAPASAYLGVLGITGLTAYAGIVEIAQVKAGETVYISAAGGAVGSIAGQIAKLLGATTIGSTGSEQNVQFLLDELQYDRAFSARDGSIAAELRREAPEGIDVYFDNVGGETLDAALASLKVKGRIATCGMIAGYCERVEGPKNLFMLISKRLRMQGFLVSDHVRSYPAFLELVAPALRDGRIVAPETFVYGLENAPAALMSLFERGNKRGKLLVRLR
jgi:NADPH-dependent curcumin reductase CurA